MLTPSLSAILTPIQAEASADLSASGEESPESGVGLDSWLHLRFAQGFGSE